MRVIDKRMFNADGELRDEVRQELEDFKNRPPEPTPLPAPAPTPAAAKKPEVPIADSATQTAPNSDTGPADPHFARLIMTLSNQAGLYLGLLVDPLNPAGTVDLPVAKSFIDMLVMIEAKTRGRLNGEEAELIESVTYELKMAYVERSKRPARP